MEDQQQQLQVAGGGAEGNGAADGGAMAAHMQANAAEVRATPIVCVLLSLFYHSMGVSSPRWSGVLLSVVLLSETEVLFPHLSPVFFPFYSLFVFGRTGGYTYLVGPNPFMGVDFMFRRL